METSSRLRELEPGESLEVEVRVRDMERIRTIARVRGAEVRGGRPSEGGRVVVGLTRVSS